MAHLNKKRYLFEGGHVLKYFYIHLNDLEESSVILLTPSVISTQPGETFVLRLMSMIDAGKIEFFDSDQSGFEMTPGFAKVS